MPLDTTCLYSTIRNSSGGRKIFSFLPPHGRELVANQEVTYFGDIRDLIVGGDPVANNRRITAFKNAVARGDLVIVNSPSPILEAPNGTSYMLSVANGGALSASDPCWTQSESA